MYFTSIEQIYIPNNLLAFFAPFPALTIECSYPDRMELSHPVLFDLPLHEPLDIVGCRMIYFFHDPDHSLPVVVDTAVIYLGSFPVCLENGIASSQIRRKRIANAARVDHSHSACLAIERQMSMSHQDKVCVHIRYKPEQFLIGGIDINSHSIMR